MCVCILYKYTGLRLAFATAEPDPPQPHTYMSVESPVVYFELVDEDLHGASDLVDL